MKWLNGNKMRLAVVGIMAFVVLGSGSVKADFTWTQKADMPTPRWMPTSATVNGRIYVIGGVSSEPDSKVLSTVEEYDPASNIWTRKADMPKARGWIPPSSPVVDGKIYVIGGGDDIIWDLPTVEEYDPVTDTWTRKADMPTPRWCLAACAVDGKIYAIGGAPNRYTGLNVVEEYDPATDTWTRKVKMPKGVWGLCACVVDGKIYAFGGRGGLSANSIVQEYNPATDTWTLKSNMLRSTSNMASVVLDNKILVLGGWIHSNSYPYTTVQMYDPAIDEWTRETDMPANRSSLTACAVRERIYAIGGTDRPHPCPAFPTVYEISPLFDFNGDGIVDAADMCIMIDHWGEDYSLCDIGPMPWGDGIVDVEDLKILAEHLFEEIFSPKPVAYWKLDEVEGDIAYNRISDNHGILSGNPTWQPDDGMVAGALLFDGIDDYISTDPILNPTDGEFCVFAWIKGGAPGQVILSQTDGVNWLSADLSEGKLMTELIPPISRSPVLPLVSEAIIVDGNWHHIGFWWNKTCRTLYVDGVVVAEDVQNNLASSANGLYIGTGKGTEDGTFFSGLIDDIRIYNKALSPEEIAALTH